MVVEFFHEVSSLSMLATWWSNMENMEQHVLFCFTPRIELNTINFEQFRRTPKNKDFISPQFTSEKISLEVPPSYNVL